MSDSSSSVVIASPIFGSVEKKTSVGLSSAASTKATDSAGSLLPSLSPTAKEMLLQLQMDGSKPPRHRPSPRDLSPESRALLQKGIILQQPEEIDPSIPLSDLNRLSFPVGTTKRETAVLIPSLPDQGQQQKQLQNGPTYHTTCDSDLSLPDTPNSQAYDIPGSPDSGYNDRSSRDSTISFQRASAVSRGASSLWSSRESELRLVEEETAEDEGEEQKERGASNTSSDLSQPSLSFSFAPEETHVPNSSRFSTSSFFTPDEETLIPVTTRRGIQRSHSIEDATGRRLKNTAVVPPVAESNTSETRGRRKSGERKGRSQSLLVKEGNTRSSPFLDSKDTFQIQDELSKENYHFVLSDALISVIEEYKSLRREQAYEEYLTTLSANSIDSAGGAGSPNSPDSLLPPPHFTPSSSDSPSSPDRVHEEILEKQQESSSSVITKTESPVRNLSLFRLVDYCEVTSTAETTAHGLLQYIARLLGGASSVEFRVPDVIQLPSDFISSIKREEQLQYSVTANSTQIRGGIDWAPPRKTIIHTVYMPANARDLHIALRIQNHRCAGCGLKMDMSQSKFFRFCYYTGKYFCYSCHQNSLSSIPAYIINRWVFKKLPVSNFARDTLVEIEKEPHFNLESLNSSLYSRIYELKKVKESRDQLKRMRKYVLTCRMRPRSLLDQFSQLEHIAGSDIHIYSLYDFHMVKSGSLSKQLRTLVHETEKHIKGCLVCQGQGFVCEFCQNGDDIIYPFELNRVSQCAKCHCCFHKDCHRNSKGCPKCKRLRERQQTRLKETMALDDDLEM